MNARQRRLFEDAHKKNPHLKVPELQPVSNWTEADLALIKQGVGDKSTRPASAQGFSAGSDESTGEEVGSVVTYFGEKGRNPIAFIEKDWQAETWTRGCYGGNPGPGVLTDYGPALRQPIGRVHWAGTETATIWAGYMDGAVRSGERAAAEALARL